MCHRTTLFRMLCRPSITSVLENKSVLSYETNFSIEISIFFIFTFTAFSYFFQQKNMNNLVVWKYQESETNKWHESRRQKWNIICFLAVLKSKLLVAYCTFYLSLDYTSSFLYICLHNLIYIFILKQNIVCDTGKSYCPQKSYRFTEKLSIPSIFQKPCQVMATVASTMYSRNKIVTPRKKIVPLAKKVVPSRI